MISEHLQPLSPEDEGSQRREQQSVSEDSAVRPQDPPSSWEEIGNRPFAFPPPPLLRLSTREELAKLVVPNDVPVRALEKMRERRDYKRYVNYPTRLFHLRPQSNLRIPQDLGWEKAFLWQTVSSLRCDAAWVQEFPYPALEVPLRWFPEAILRRGMTMHLSETPPLEALDFASAVLRTPGRGRSDPEPSLDTPWRDVKQLAVRIIEALERRGHPGAVAMAAKIRDHERARDDYRSFFRFRDADRKPTGMGFRGTRDIFFLDDQYLTDFLNRANQTGALSRRIRSDVRLISFLNSLDAAKVTTLAVSASAFRKQKARAYLCYVIARTFPNLKRLHLTSVGPVDGELARGWGITPQQPRFAKIQNLVKQEIRLNGGSSYLPRPHEDTIARFDIINMSRAMVNITGAYAHGGGRITAGEPSWTPLVAFGIRAGLIHDPDPDQTLAGQTQDPPFVKAVQHMLSAAFRLVIRRREAAAQAARAEALAKLEGRRTKIPRPVRGLRGLRGLFGAAQRLYRRSEVTPQDVKEWVVAHVAKTRHRAASVREVEAEVTDHKSEDSLQAREVGPFDREYARVEPFVLICDRNVFDSNVQSGWTGFGPGVDLSHFGCI
jgi:hypothetical protein